MDESTTGMDAYFAIATIRAVRQYSDKPISDESLWRILQAGRAAGSSRNRQPWTFYVIRNRATLESLAEQVYAPENIRGCQLAIAIVLSNKQSFDAGRAAQNMMLAAWTEGIGTCPNTSRDPDATRALMNVADDVLIATTLSVGYPERPLRPKRRNVDAILSRIKRKPLDEITRFID
jgi:nitroreductase